PLAAPCASHLKGIVHSPILDWDARFPAWNTPVPVTVDVSPQVPPGMVKPTSNVELSTTPARFARICALGSVARGETGSEQPANVTAATARSEAGRSIGPPGAGRRSCRQ